MTQTSIAPTGTISIISGTSSGIEPLFALAYRRRQVLSEQTLTEFNPLLLRYLEKHRLISPELLDAIAQHGRLIEEAGVPPDLRHLFATALDIPPEQHLRLQAAFQQHVNNAVSKTINQPQEATTDEIANIYRLAHQLGCKGVTVFCYGSKTEQVLE